MENQHHPERKEFQLERIILFTDAVFAIAITLLVIELHVPELSEHATEKDFWYALLGLMPKFIGFVVSFFIIGLYWYVHHNMFGFVINYTSKLLWLNLLFLFTIVLMPFSTSVYSEYSTEQHINLVSPFAIYVANIGLTGIMNFVLLNYIFNPKNKVSEYIPNKATIIYAKRRALAIPTIFMISLLLTILTPEYGRLFLFTIPFVIKFLKPKKMKVVSD